MPAFHSSGKVRVNKQLASRDKAALILIFLVSVVVFLTVAVLSQLPKSEHLPEPITYLPGINASINAICTLLLIVSWFSIKKGNVTIHRRLNLTTFALSALFLLSYVTYHAFGVETRFPAEHPLRPAYLLILGTHIILAAVVLPLVLLSFYWALSGQISRHRKTVRYSYPIWLYVTSTGVIVYLMISPYYPF